MTKIVCTMGPSSDKKAIVNELVQTGLNVARLNFSHAGSDYTYPKHCMDLVRSACDTHCNITVEPGVSVANNTRAVLVDTKGPEIRTGPLQGNAEIAEIADGALVEVTTQDVSSDEPPSPEGPHRLQVDYQSIAKSLEVGRLILLDDGLLALEVQNIDADTNTVSCVALNGGPIKKNKGVNLPDTQLDLPALTDKDKRDLKWACEVGADYVAASFIRTPDNVRSVVAYLERCCAALGPTHDGRHRLRPLVISKIESKEGVDNFDAILEESDGIMVARGDLGVEIPFEDVFAGQKMMVSACNAVGKPVIVATQMLDSMQRNPRPTRAEVTDVGTAVLDGADAVMLSGETAAGKYPLESVLAMRSVVNEADKIKNKDGAIVCPEARISMPSIKAELDSVAESAVRSAKDLNAKVVVCITQDGAAARALARHRPTVPVLAFCTDPQVARRLQLHRSIVPLMFPIPIDPTDRNIRMGPLRAEAIRAAKEFGFVRTGDRVVTVDRTHGKTTDLHEISSNVKISTISSAI
eukprot:CAMPEP_0195523272 /NCGR_PEP_ID=MMETSP0794_2-20130614/22255_1 /TAXON_ID=515487 /ORGANISM="Stephanopyxis turris, Strain CCMP 815" /LENGTH=523 /DNA_ID=CAMNT_0040653231 /DNA_START=191 /DNA_END=1762 /DNA_ORIENTATION=+